MNQSFSSSAFQFRWLNGQCFEIKLNNGKTIITDPWFSGTDSLSRVCPKRFSIDDIDACDYILLNHTHGDHTANIPELVEKFHPILISHSATIMELARNYHIPVTSLYPIDYEGTYLLDGFTLDTYHGTHYPSKLARQEFSEVFGKLPGSVELNAMGSAFNVNYVITTDQGMRVLFMGANDDGMIEKLRGNKKPNLVLHNHTLPSSVKDKTAAKDFAEWFARFDGQLMIPMHYEAWITDDPEFAEQVMIDMDKILEEKGKSGRVAPLVRTQWYSLDLCINEIETGVTNHSKRGDTIC